MNYLACCNVSVYLSTCMYVCMYLLLNLHCWENWCISKTDHRGKSFTKKSMLHIYISANLLHKGSRPLQQYKECGAAVIHLS